MKKVVGRDVYRIKSENDKIIHEIFNKKLIIDVMAVKNRKIFIK